MKDITTEIKSINKSTNPIINIIDKESFYDIHIILKNLIKEEIIIKYINNFLVLHLSLKNKNNDQLKFKKMFYLKKVDINTLENFVQANYIYLKINKT